MAVTFTRVQEGNKIILTFLRETGQTLSTFTRCIFEKLLFYREHHFLFYETHFFIETYPFFLKLLHFFWQFHQKKRRFFVLKHEFLVSFCKKMRFQKMNNKKNIYIKKRRFLMKLPKKMK